MSKLEKKPEIRIKGFTESWEQRKLGEVGNTFTGLSGKTKEDFGHGKAKYVTYMNVFNNPIMNTKILEPIEIDNKQNAIQKGDVFFTTSSETPEEVGMSSVCTENTENVYLNSFCFGFRPNIEIDSYYLAYMLRSKNMRDKFILLAQGISRYNISKTQALEIEISLPNLDEQRKIGMYFKKLDNLINLHQRKHDKLVKVKKALLDKIFTKNNSKIPEIRFKGFKNFWEQRMLGEITTIIMGQSPEGVNYTDNSEDTVLIQGNADLNNGEVVPRIWTTQITKTTEPNDIIFTVRAPVGEVAKNQYFAVIGRGVASLKGNEFLYQALRKMKESDYWTRLSVGSTFDSINSEQLKDSEINLPEKNEQDKIGNLFNKLDSLINIHQQKLEKIKNLKNACLDKMFI